MRKCESKLIGELSFVRYWWIDLTRCSVHEDWGMEESALQNDSEKNDRVWSFVYITCSHALSEIISSKFLVMRDTCGVLRVMV